MKKKSHLCLRSIAQTGKEKQINTNLVANVTATAIRTPVYQRTAIVLVTGDANVIPALEKVLEEDHWQIEVYVGSCHIKETQMFC